MSAYGGSAGLAEIEIMNNWRAALSGQQLSSAPRENAASWHQHRAGSASGSAQYQRISMASAACWRSLALWQRLSNGSMASALIRMKIMSKMAAISSMASMKAKMAISCNNHQRSNNNESENGGGMASAAAKIGGNMAASMAWRVAA